LAETAPDIRAHIVRRPAFADVGRRMLAAWSTGAIESLGLTTGFG
jgi:hypothetical protein